MRWRAPSIKSVRRLEANKARGVGDSKYVSICENTEKPPYLKRCDCRVSLSNIEGGCWGRAGRSFSQTSPQCGRHQGAQLIHQLRARRNDFSCDAINL